MGDKMLNVDGAVVDVVSKEVDIRSQCIPSLTGPFTGISHLFSSPLNVIGYTINNTAVCLINGISVSIKSSFNSSLSTTQTMTGTVNGGFHTLAYIANECPSDRSRIIFCCNFSMGTLIGRNLFSSIRLSLSNIRIRSFLHSINLLHEQRCKIRTTHNTFLRAE